MKKNGLFVLMLSVTCLLYSQNAIDIGSLKEHKISPLNKDEKLICESNGTNNGFELNIYALNEYEQKRILGCIKNFSGYIEICDNDIVYFSVDNYSNWENDGKSYDAIFELNAKKGKIIKLLDGMAFSASSDGLFICYEEPWQHTENESHEEAYRYIYNTKKKKQIIIIDKRMKNNYQVSGPEFDKKTKQFIFSLGFDADVLDYQYFNPYEMKW